MWREAFSLTDDICKALRKSAQRKDVVQISPEIVQDAVSMVMRHHYLSGLTMGCKVRKKKKKHTLVVVLTKKQILRVLKEEEFSRFSGLTKALLSPTVYDGFSGGASQASSDLNYVLTHAKVSFFCGLNVPVVFLCHS
jgi:hypothetical protein